MKRSVSKASVALAAASLLAACTASSASSDSFPSTFMTDEGKIKVALSSSPEQPPYAGNDSLQLILTDPNTGKPIDGEQMSLVPFMPTMGHGTSVVPQCQAMGGGGRYVCDNVYLFMPGEWQLRFTFSGPVSDSAAPDIPNVQ
jgi:ABC-type glycerol-3-phosphate transport system substrate-binding protein